MSIYFDEIIFFNLKVVEAFVLVALGAVQCTCHIFLSQHFQNKVLIL